MKPGADGLPTALLGHGDGIAARAAGLHNVLDVDDLHDDTDAGVVHGRWGGVALALAFPLLDYRLAWVIVRGLVFLCWNFPLQRDYVYGRDGGPALETDRARRRHLPRTHRDEATGESA